ncbi:beta strand repeat-containing protein [Nanoarchaeota archaeon]
MNKTTLSIFLVFLLCLVTVSATGGVVVTPSSAQVGATLTCSMPGERANDNFYWSGAVSTTGKVVSANVPGTYTCIIKRNYPQVGELELGRASATISAVPVPPPVNQAPTANFNSNSPVVNGTNVTFTDTSTDSDGTVVAWEWNFGDSANSTVQDPQHLYSTTGNYTVTLTVTDNDGAASTPFNSVVEVTSVPTTCPAPASGNWTINGTQNVYCEGVTLNLDQIDIYDSATAVFNNSALNINNGISTNNNTILTLENSTLDEIYANANSSISVVNSNITDEIDVSDNATLNVQTSDVDEIYSTTDANVNVDNSIVSVLTINLIGGGSYSGLIAGTTVTTTVGTVNLVNTYVGSVGVQFANGIFNIDSFQLNMVSWIFPDVTLNMLDSTLDEIFITSNTLFNADNVTINDIQLMGDNSTVNFTSSTLVQSLRANVIATFNNYILGTVNMLVPPLATQIQVNNTLERHYPVTVVNQTGPMNGAQVNITNSTSDVLFSGATDATGNLEVVLTFDNNTEADVYDVYVDGNLQGNISLLTSTPIIINISSIPLPPIELILVNEFEQNPIVNGTEWVELYNPGASTVDISAWEIWDGLTTPSLIHTVPANTTLAADSYYVANISGTQLNNADEYVTLYDQYSREVDNTSTLADAAPLAYCWARFPNGAPSWNFQNCTYGATNNLPGVNLPPQITSNFTLPDVSSSINISTNVTFFINVMDPEGSNMTINWSVDGVVNQTYLDYPNGSALVPTLDYTFDENRSYLVEVFVYDNESAYDYMNWTVQVVNGTIPDTTAPAAITGLALIGATNETLTWTWMNPADPDFDHTIVFLDGVNVVNITNSGTGVDNYTATGLLNYTQHTINVHTVDTSGNENLTNVTDTQFTLQNNDTTAPVISNVQAVSITNESAIINWTTDEASDSSINVEGTVNTFIGLVTNHSVPTPGTLAPNTTYFYNVTSCDANSNCATSVQYNFTTQANINLAPNATITNPLTGSQYQNGSAIVFNGTGVDLEDGNLTGASLVWTSDLDGALGTGNGLSVSTLTIGNHTITLTATDSGLLTDNDSIQVEVILTPTNNQPVFDSSAVNTNVHVTSPYSFDVNASDADLLDVLTFTDNLAEFVINSTSGLITFTPNTVGMVSGILTVCDNSGFPNNCTNQTFDLNVTNSAPQFNTSAVNTNVHVGTLFTFDVNASDADLDTLSFTDDIAEFVIDPVTGVISFTPANISTIAGTITVCDNTESPNNCTTQAFNLDVTNNAPVLNGIGAQAVNEGSSLNIPLSSTDADSDTLVLAASNLPNGSSLTDNGDGTGSFNWTPGFADSGVYVVTFNVTDPYNGLDSEAVTITVNDNVQNGFIDGFVRDDLGGDIAGATVEIKNGSFTVASGISGITGYFNITITEGTYDVLVYSLGFVDNQTNGVVVTEFATTRNNATLQTVVTTGDINGTVTDGTNNIFAATVQLKQGASVIASTTTDMFGYYSFTGENIGAYDLVVIKPAFTDSTTAVSISATPTTQNVVLSAPGTAGTISGTIRDALNAPITAVTNVTITSSTTGVVQIVQTDGTGYYVFNGLPATVGFTYDLDADLVGAYTQTFPPSGLSLTQGQNLAGQDIYMI